MVARECVYVSNEPRLRSRGSWAERAALAGCTSAVYRIDDIYDIYDIHDVTVIRRQELQVGIRFDTSSANSSVHLSVLRL